MNAERILESRTIPRSQLLAAYEALGLDPDEWRFIGRMVWNPHSITIERVARDENGKAVYQRDVGEEGEWLIEKLELEVADD